MDIKVKGGQLLSGEIYPSGSKNSAVHIIPCTLLFKEVVTLENIPEITDVERLVRILTKLGSKIRWNKQSKILAIDNSKVSFERLSKSDLGEMKGASLFWGALLARFGKVDFAGLPGGCTLGIRPVEPIYRAFKDLGVEIEKQGNGVVMNVENAKGGDVLLSEMSPTATTNAIMVAVSLKGKTKISGAASEPQVQDVCKFLMKAGVNISGVGSSVLEIEGGKALSAVKHRLLSDHYEIATFLALGAVTGGEVRVHDAIPEYFKMINREFKKFNVEVGYDGNTAIVKKSQSIKILGKFEDKTNVVRPQPWPAIPVDLLPVFIPLAMASSSGYVVFHNWMYETGLFWTSELIKLGAEVIMSDPHRVIVFGGRKLNGATLEAPYIIRAVVAMVMAAMISKGESMILDADALYRGHPNFAENLKKLGAKIEVIQESQRGK